LFEAKFTDEIQRGTTLKKVAGWKVPKTGRLGTDLVAHFRK